MRASAAISLIALGLASCAQARVMPGVFGPTPYIPTPNNQTLSFGALTPAGYGGTTAGSPGGVLSIGSTTCQSGGLNNFVIDANNMLVPNDSTHSYESSLYGKHGALESLGGTSCNITLSNGYTTVIDTIQIAANTFTIRGMYRATDHEDGKYTFSGGQTNSGFQLGNLIGQSQTSTYPSVPLGSTIVCRDSQMNPVGAYRLVVNTPTPVGGQLWSGTGRIVVKSENPVTSGTDSDGNPLEGGGCQMALIELLAGSSTYNFPQPFDFQNINFAENPSSPSNLPWTVPLLFLTSGGWTVTHSNFSVGDNAYNADAAQTGIFGIGGAYAGTETKTLPQEAAVVSDSHFYQSLISVSGLGANTTPYSAVGSTPQYTIQRNVIKNPFEKGIQLSARNAPVVTDNLIFGLNATGAQHGDHIIFGASCIYSTPGNCGLVAGSNADGTTAIVARNIFVHGRSITNGAQSLAFVGVQTAPTSPTNGRYGGNSDSIPVIATTTNGAGRGLYATLLVSGCPTACAYTATPYLNWSVAAPTASFTGAITGNVLTVSGNQVINGKLGSVNIGATVLGAGVDSKTQVSGQLSGTGGSNGTYSTSGPAQSIGPEVMTSGTPPTQSGGRNYMIGDLVYVPYSGGTLVFTVGTLWPTSDDALGIFQPINSGGDTVGTFQIYNNILDTVDGDTLYLTFFAGALVNNNDAAVDFLSHPPAYGQPFNINGTIWGIGNPSSTSNFDLNVTNTWNVPTNSSCAPASSPSTCVTTAKTTAAYRAIWPNWNPPSVTRYNRASWIAMHTPAAGTTTTALCPPDNNSVVYWNVPGVGCDVTATHTPAQ